MPQQKIDIIISGQDQFTSACNKVTKSLDNITAKGIQFGRELRMAGREISYIGMRMTAMGGLITAPMILAFKEAGKYSAEASHEIWRLQNTFTNLSVSIGKSLTPVIKQFTDFLSRLVDKWLELDPVVRDNIVKTVFMGGVYLTVGGIITTVIGQIISSVGVMIIIFFQAFGKLAGLLGFIINLIKGIGIIILTAFTPAYLPFTILLGIIIAIVIAMLKWKEVATAVGNYMEGYVNVIKVAFNGVRLVIDLVIKDILRLNEMLTRMASRLPKGLGGDFFKQWNAELKLQLAGVNAQIEEDAGKTEEAVDKLNKSIGNLLSGTEGDFATKVNAFISDLKSKGIAETIGNLGGDIGKAFGAMLNIDLSKGITLAKQQIINFQKVLGLLNEAYQGKGGGKSAEGTSQTTGGFWAGFETGLEQTSQELAKWNEFGQQQAKDMVNGMQASFHDFFMDAFTGDLKSAEEYFKSFAKSILNVFANMLSRMMAEWMVSGIKSIFMGGGKNSGSGSLLGSIKGIFGGMGGGGGAIVGGVGGQIINTAQFGTTWSPFHKGGIIKAHQGLAIDEVPIIAQSGEGILSRRGMSNLARLNNSEGMGGEVHLHITQVIQAWDATDVYRNRKILSDAIAQEIKTNSTIRKVMRKYV